MGKSKKQERYAWMLKDGKHWLDVYYYKDGTQIFNLRKQVPKNAIWNSASGKKLARAGAPVLQFIISAKGEPKAPWKNKSNKQEKKDGEGAWQARWRGWYNRWNEYQENFKLEGVIVLD